MRALRGARLSAPSAPSARVQQCGAARAAGTRYTVRRGDTLSAVASQAYPGGDRHMRQRELVAIYRTNPTAFHGNMNLLLSGSRLDLPGSTEVDAISPGEASSEVRRQYSAWAGAHCGRHDPCRHRSQRAAAPGAAAGVGEDTGGWRSPRPPTPTALPPALASAASAAAAAASAAALNQRVQQLESQLAESQRLLQLRNADLAALQARAAQSAANKAPAPTAPAATAPAPAPAAAPPPPPGRPYRPGADATGKHRAARRAERERHATGGSAGGQAEERAGRGQQ